MAQLIVLAFIMYWMNSLGIGKVKDFKKRYVYEDVSDDLYLSGVIDTNEAFRL